MTAKFNIQERISVFLAALVFGVVSAKLVFSKLAFHPAYPEFIVGSITWRAQTKSQDLLVPVIFVLVFLSSAWVVSKFIVKLKSSNDSKSTDEFCENLNLWAIPMLMGIGPLIVDLKPDPKLFAFSALGMYLYGSLCAINYWRCKWFSPREISCLVVAFLFIGLFPLEIFLLLSRWQIIEGSLLGRFIQSSINLLILGYFFLVIFNVYLRDKIIPVIPKLLFMGQMGLPLLFVVLHPASFTTPEGRIVYSSDWGLIVIILGFALWAYWDIGIRGWRYLKNKDLGSSSLISPVALIGLYMALRLGVAYAPNISSDDYHFGELLLGWWVWIDHGQIPYIDYLTPHGLIDDFLPGLSSLIFFDGSAAAVYEGGRIAYALLSSAAYYIFYRVTKSLPLAFLSILLFDGYSGLRTLFIVIFLCIFLSRALRNNPLRWLILWTISIPVVILCVPAQGLALITAMSPLALWFLWRVYQDKRKQLWIALASVAIALLVVGVLTPIPEMLFGAIQYVLENGPINQVAYGVEWYISWANTGSYSGSLYELFRISWILLPISAIYLLWAYRKDVDRRISVYSVAVPILLLVTFMIPYSMGRIDPGFPSRMGLLSIFSWTFLLPLLLWDHLNSTKRIGFLLLIALFASGQGMSTPSINKFVTAMNQTLPSSNMKDGVEAGFLKMGRGIVEEWHWDRLTHLKKTMDRILQPGETYLDLTGHNAHYFYLNRPPVISVTAPYNMAPIPQQKRIVAGLMESLPRIVLLEDSVYNIYNDGGKLSLRTPVLYRFILTHYQPVWVDGFVVGVRNDQAKSKAFLKIPIKNFSDVNWEKGIFRSQPAFIVDGVLLMQFFDKGDTVIFENGAKRKVVQVREDVTAVWVSGGKLDPDRVGAPHSVSLRLTPKEQKELKLKLLDKVFAQPDLQGISVAWGRSNQSLSSQMTSVLKIDKFPRLEHHLKAHSEGYQITGNDPFMMIDLGKETLRGGQAGLLRFDFRCEGRTEKPRLQIFWWGDDQKGPEELASVFMDAENGTMIVPLDINPRWLTLSNANGLRLDLANPKACKAIDFTHLELLNRNSTLEYGSDFSLDVKK